MMRLRPMLAQRRPTAAMRSSWRHGEAERLRGTAATSPLPNSGKRCTGTAARDFTLLRLIDLQLFENVASTLDRRRDLHLCRVED